MSPVFLATPVFLVSFSSILREKDQRGPLWAPPSRSLPGTLPLRILVKNKKTGPKFPIFGVISLEFQAKSFIKVYPSNPDFGVITFRPAS